MFKLRELTREDLSVINDMRNNKNLIELLGAPYRFINIETENQWFDNYLKNRQSNIRCTILNEDNTVIGLVSLTNINRINQSATLHIMIGEEKNQGQGAGTHATKEILNHAFLDMNLNRVELSVLETNKRAIQLYKKIGFKEEGLKRQAVFKGNSFKDMLIMSILKNEFK